MRWSIAAVIAGTAFLLGLWLAFGDAGEPQSSPALEAESAEPLREPEPLAEAPADADREELVAEPEPEPPTSPAGASDSASKDLVVRILDARGEAAGDLAVVLSAELAEHTAMEQGQFPFGRFAVKGDLPRNGIRVSAAKVEAALAKARAIRDAGRAISVRLKPGFASPACTSYEFAELEIPSEDIDLRIEPRGYLRIEACGADGRPFDGKLSAQLWVLGEAADIDRRETYAEAPRIAKQLWRDRAPFCLPLGKSVLLELSEIENRVYEHRERIAGPTSEGEEIAWRIELRSTPVATGRLLAADRQVLADQPFRFELRAGGSRSGGWRRTDVLGRFRISFLPRENVRRIVDLRILPVGDEQKSGNSTDFETRPTAERTGIEMPESGELDLGDLIVEPAELPLLASGMVVDSEGQAIADAWISSMGVWPPTSEGPWSERIPMDGATSRTNDRTEPLETTLRSSRSPLRPTSAPAPSG